MLSRNYTSRLPGPTVPILPWSIFSPVPCLWIALVARESKSLPKVHKIKMLCIQGNLIILLAENIVSSLIDIMHSIGRYDIVNCNGLSCFCELRLIDFRESSSGLLRDIYFSFLATKIIQQHNLSSLLGIKSLAIFEAVIRYHSKVKQDPDSLVQWAVEPIIHACSCFNVK